MSERNTSSLDSALPSSNLDEQIELGSHSDGGRYTLCTIPRKKPFSSYCTTFSVLLDSPQEEVPSVPVVDEAVESGAFSESFPRQKLILCTDGSWHSVDEDDDDDDDDEDDENDDDDDEDDDNHDHDDDDDGSAVEGGFDRRAASVAGCSHYQRNCRSRRVAACRIHLPLPHAHAEWSPRAAARSALPSCLPRHL
jgi:hypothetical protein